MIYLDYQATTPLAPEAREAMLRWLDGPEGMGFGNPHSPHRLGRQAHAAVEVAREQVSALFPAGGQIVFTSGATEALNIALRGVAPSLRGKPVAASAIEHAAVLETVQSVFDTRHVLPVSEAGVVDAQVPLPDTLGLLALMQVNNEIGTVQPVQELYRRAREIGAVTVCDAVQAAGRMPLVEVDLIAISAHKFHGPKGVGALWVRDGIELCSTVTGGGQEAGIRSGTLSPALCAGMGAAAEVALQRMEQDAAHVSTLWRRGRELLSDWQLNGSADARYHGNLNVRKPGLDLGRLMSDVREVCFSAGSACASGSGRPSHVLRAIGLSTDEAKSSIRLGFGRYTTLDELERAVGMIMNAAAQQG